MNQSEPCEKCDDNNSEDSKEVGSRVDKKEWTTFMVDFMEWCMRPTSKIVLKGLSASDLTPCTAASEAESEILKNVRKDTALSYKV